MTTNRTCPYCESIVEPDVESCPICHSFIGIIADIGPCESPQQGSIDESREIVAIWNGKLFRRNDRVQIAQRLPVTFKPAKTGHAVDIDADEGHTGLVIRGEPGWLDQTSYEISIEIEYGLPIPMKRDTSKPNAILVVQWDSQQWTETIAEK
jgi:hypothetical protein